MRAIERALVSVHAQAFPKAARVELPAPEEVDAEAIKADLEKAAGIPDLMRATGGGETPPVASVPDPVDRYALMRENRKRRREGIPIWRIRERLEAARVADRDAEDAAETEKERRAEAQRAEQAHLDELWMKLGVARDKVAAGLTAAVAAERDRRTAERKAEQERLDEEWKRLLRNDPAITIATLEHAFADNEAPAAPIDCDGERTTVVLQFPSPEEIVPERKPARTPTGKPTLKKRTKTEVNELYLEALGSNVLATVKETFAVAPGTQTVQILVIRREEGGKRTSELAAIYAGAFERDPYEAAGPGRDPGRALTLVDDACLKLKGKTNAVAPIDIGEWSDLREVLAQVEDGLSQSE